MVERTATARRRGVRLVAMVVACLTAGLVLQTLVAIGIVRYGATAQRFVQTGMVPEVQRTRWGDGVLTIIWINTAGMQHYCAVMTNHPVSARDLVLTEPSSRPAALPRWVALPPSDNHDLWYTGAFGWPLQSCRGHNADALKFQGWGALPAAWQEGLGLFRHELESLRPIPLNTLANSAFYGVIVAGVWLIARTACRRWRSRFRPGTCTHCGYALAGLPAAALCPECGQARG